MHGGGLLGGLVPKSSDAIASYALACRPCCPSPRAAPASSAGEESARAAAAVVRRDSNPFALAGLASGSSAASGAAARWSGTGPRLDLSSRFEASAAAARSTLAYDVKGGGSGCGQACSVCSPPCGGGGSGGVGSVVANRGRSPNQGAPSADSASDSRLEAAYASAVGLECLGTEAHVTWRALSCAQHLARASQ